jgi:hypothetical protein
LQVGCIRIAKLNQLGVKFFDWKGPKGLPNSAQVLNRDLSHLADRRCIGFWGERGIVGAKRRITGGDYGFRISLWVELQGLYGVSKQTRSIVAGVIHSSP